MADLIPPDQLKISAQWTTEPAPRGGQTVGTPRVVRVEHEPTGIVIMVPGYSQYKARELAIEALEHILTNPKLGKHW